MRFNEHLSLQGQHAFLGASKYHWINYDEEKISAAYLKHLAVERGTELHAYASESIRLGQKLQSSKKTLNMYVNDAIAYRLTPEQVLYYSPNCFGTADAIGFNTKKKFLRIHDLKTGQVPAHMEQLEIYAALFCLEYGFKPEELGMELRLYQNDEILIHAPDPEKINFIMEKIIIFDKRLEAIQTGE